MLRQRHSRQGLLVLAACQLFIGLNIEAEAVTPQIRLAPDHAVLLKGDGTVWQWGAVKYGRVKQTVGCVLSHDTSATPVPVNGVSSVTAIAVAGTQSIALKSDGTVWAWGPDPQMDMGYGCTNLAPYFKLWQVTETSGAGGLMANVTGIWGASGSFFARKSDGSVMAWGHNDMNKLGVDVPAQSKKTAAPPPEVASVALPLPVIHLKNASPAAWPPIFPMLMTSGGTHSLALLPDRSVRAWGGAQYGERGDAAYGYAPYWNGYVWYDTPSTASITGVTALAAGLYKSLAIKSDGTLWVWGCNQYGELGNAIDVGVAAPCSHAPVRVNEISGAAAVATAGTHTAVLLANGTVWAMGFNGGGLLGNDPVALARSYTPIQVTGLSGVTAIDAAGTCSVALKGDGTVWEWGNCPDNTYSWMPVQVNAGVVASTASCGSASGESFSAAPLANLCATGAASAVTGSGPWQWSCGPVNGGSVACSASNGPIFKLHPVSRRYFLGQTATLRAIAVGNGALSYQWYKATRQGDVRMSDRRGITTKMGSTSSVSGAATPQLTISGLVAGDGAPYFVEVRDQLGGMARSDRATVDLMLPVTPTRPGGLKF